MGFESFAFCNCEACAGARSEPQYAGDGLAGLTGDKPVWSLDQIVAALTRWDARWGPETVPYTFYTSAPAHLAGKQDWQGFVSFSPEQREAARLAMDLIADVANLHFIERPDDGTVPSGANPRLTFSTSLSTAQHFTGYADVEFAETFELGDAHRITSAELMLNAHRWNGGMEPGARPFLVLMHEILHAVGLPHPADYNRNANEEITYSKHAIYAQDSVQFTVMSYFSASVTGSKHAGFAQTPLLHDVAALQTLYGANTATRASDTVYGYGSTAGRSMFDFAQNPAPIFTIWDAGGIDRLDFTNTNAVVDLDLSAGAFSDAFNMTGNISIAHGVTIEHANGGGAGDRLVGNAANNVLRGMGGDDRLDGGEGDDLLDGGDGRDAADYSAASNGLDIDLSRTGAQDTGFGKDTLVGLEILYGSDHADRLAGGGAAEEIYGGLGSDILYGRDGDDRLEGEDQNDQLYGDAGRDTLIGGSGFDLLAGQDGDDRLEGGGQDDQLYGDAGQDVLVGGAGNDRMLGQDGGDGVFGEDGNDALSGGAGFDLLAGQNGDDRLEGGDQDDMLYGDAGQDTLYGQSGDDRLFGQDGSDGLFGDDGADTISGGAGLDLLAGQNGDDRLEGGDEDDQLYGDAGEDTLVGGTGADLMLGQDGSDGAYGEDGNDTISGGAGFDLLAGQDGDDRLHGGENDDQLYGDAGDDRLTGGPGADSLVGGLGADVFDLERVAELDVARDFNRNEGDRVSLGGLRFNSLTVADVNGDGVQDSQLVYDGGSFVALGVSDLTLDGWNALVL